MRFDNNKWVTNILKVVDTLNTLNGGMSSPSFKLVKFDDKYKLYSKTPGVSPEALRVEVVEDKLMIYHIMDFGYEEVNGIPNILKVLPIPKGVEVSKISAEYEDKKLIVIMPLGNKTEGLYHSIDININ